MKSRGETWAIVPLKTPETAKSRLAPALNAGERRRLYLQIARHVVRTLVQTPMIARVVVVTSSEEMATLARECGAETLRQANDRGTAQAFADALESLSHAARVLMIAGDLPLLSVAAVEQLLALRLREGEILVAPDRHRIGTNALLCALPCPIPLCFGEDSLRRHQAAARERGVPLRMFESEALGMDLDLPADLEAWRARLANEKALAVV